ncbi:MAG: hypothetical protein H0S79_00165 [Anaerolineaceae bacterium]|nr:hypothetical protein [Anaerolineaceae bacterium]
MKKLILVTLTVLMTLSLSACVMGSQTYDENLLGTWTLDSVTIDGIAVDLTVDSSAMIPYDYTFTFLENGNAVADVLGISYTTTYQVTDGIITFGNAVLSALRLIVDGDTLLLKNDVTRATLTFTK